MFSNTQAVYYWIRHVRFSPVSVHFKLTSRHARFCMLLLLLGCVEPNPGPVANSYPCGVCTHEVEDFGARAIACNACDTWTHKSCVGMLTPDFDQLANSSTPWYCPDCGTPHHSEIIYDGLEDASIGSKYSSVSDGEPSSPISLDLHSLSSSTGPLSDTSLNTIGSPNAASSPKTTQTMKAPPRKKSLRMLNINFQSIRKKGRNIDVLIESTNPDILFGTETWLSEDIPTASFFNPILGYNVYRRDRPNSPYGGVLLATKKNIQVTNVHCHDDIELITATIQVDKKRMVLSTFYRPPDKTEESYLKTVYEAFTNLKTKFKNSVFVLAGDFNIPDVNWASNTVTGATHYPIRVSQTFLDIAMVLNLEQIVDFPTRQLNTLDLIFTSHPTFKTRCKPLPPIGQKSDHDIVLFDTAHKPRRTILPRRKIFLWKRADVVGIKEFFSLFQTTFLSKVYKDIDSMWIDFKTAVSAAVDKHVPTKMSSTRQTHPWVDTKLRRSMRRKQRAHWRAKRSGRPKDWVRYKKIQAEVQKSTRSAEMTYVHDICSDMKQNPKRFYSYIKSKGQESVGVSALLDKNGFLQSDSEKRANILNDQFQSVYTREDNRDMPDMGRSPHPTMQNIQVYPTGVAKLLKELKVTKASGPDSIPTFILKTASSEIAPILAILFQTSLDTGQVPTDWRDAQIVPIFKKGDKQLASNYRPVSLTSVTCKVLEHIIHSNVMKHFIANNILCDNQHGFRKNRSCETQLIHTIQDIASKLRKGRDQVDIILLDFAKAFDKVPHRRLLQKLHYYGISDSILHWIRSFLSQRTQQVMLEGKLSEKADVISGVPQGTVLGPLLFLAYINDLPEATTSPTRLFADDSLLYRHISGPEDAQILQKDLDALSKWEERWQMKFHPEKCQVISICTNSRFRRDTQYQLRGHTLTKVDSAKYLGVTISEDLSWTKHASNVSSKASKTLGFLRRNLHNATQEARCQAYSSFITPTLEYAATVWDPHLKTDIDRLQKVQRRGARFVLNNYWDQTPGCVTGMIQSLSWTSLADRRRELRLIMLFKIQHHLVDMIPGPILRLNDRRTRGGQRLYQPTALQSAYKTSFYPRTIQEWNRLPVAVTDMTSLEGFKTAIRLTASTY